MKSKVYLLGVLILSNITICCNKQSDPDISEYLDISVTLDNSILTRENLNIIKVDIINLSEEDLDVSEGYVKLDLTSTLTGENRSLYIDLNGKVFNPEKKHKVVLNLEGKKTLSKNIDLNKILWDYNNSIVGEYYLSLVLQVGENMSSTKNYSEDIRSNAVEVKIM